MTALIDLAAAIFFTCALVSFVQEIWKDLGNDQ